MRCSSTPRRFVGVRQRSARWQRAGARWWQTSAAPHYEKLGSRFLTLPEQCNQGLEARAAMFRDVAEASIQRDLESGKGQDESA